MGVSLTNELTGKGIEVVAFARNKRKMEDLYSGNRLVTVVSGDGLVLEELLKAAGLSRSKAVVVDNIYAYGKNPGHKVAESHPKQPHTKKGRIRLELEQKVKKAQEDGIPCLIAHFPDFYGPYGGNTLLHALLAPVSRNKRGIFAIRSSGNGGRCTI